MQTSRKRHCLDYCLSLSIKAFLFFLPWQTVWIQREIFIDGIKWQQATLQFFLSEMLLWISIICFMLWYVKEMKKKTSSVSLAFSPDRFFICSVFLFLIYSFISAFWAKDADIAFQQSLHFLGAFLFFVAVFFSSFEIKNLLRSLVYGSVLPALLGIAQFLLQSTWGSSVLGFTEHLAFEPGASVVSADFMGRWIRAYGSFSHPNIFGFYLFVSLMASTLLYVNSRKRSLADSSLFLVVCLQIMALFFTFSRSAWLAFVLWLCVLCSRRFFSAESARIRVLCFSSFIFVFLLAYVNFPVLQVRFGFRALNEIQSVQDRLSDYEQVRMLFFQHPLLGQGAGNYTQALYVWLDGIGDFPIQAWRLQPAHNAIFLALVEYGVLGFALACLSLFSYLFFLKSTGSFSKNVFFIRLLIFLPLIPLLLLDHYVLSSYPGPLLLILYFGIASRLFVSTEHPLFVHRV